MPLRFYFRPHKLHRKLRRAAHVMGPTLVALSFAGIANVARAQGTMDFSGAQTLMGTFKTFAMYAGAVICLGGLIFAGIRMMSGRFQDAIPGLFGALFGAGVLGWGAGWIGFDHGYAVTSHSSQGLTAGRVLAHFDTEGPRGLVNTRLAYVAISRASEDARIYTNDVTNLGKRLASDVSKTAAIDLTLPSRRTEVERAVSAFRENDPAAATTILQQDGRVHEYASAEHRLAAVALAYAAQQDRAVVIALDAAERRELTQLIRDELRQQGRLSSESHALPVWVERHLGNPRLADNYVSGDQIRLMIGSLEHGIVNNSIVTVLSVDAAANRLTVSTRDGNEISYNPALLRKLTSQSQVFREEIRDIAVNERIRFTANVQEFHLRKGDFATVGRIDEDRSLTVRSDQGKSITLSEEQARHIDYGYIADRIPLHGVHRVIVSGEAAQLATMQQDLARLSGQTRDVALHTSDGQGLAHQKTVDELGVSSPGLQPESQNIPSVTPPELSREGFGLGR